MVSESPSLGGQIDNALEQITKLFLEQCTHGEQTKILPGDYAACGQFVGQDAAQIQQYGLHGISAALRVLGPCPTESCRVVVRKLVWFCESIFGLRAHQLKLVCKSLLVFASPSRSSIFRGQLWNSDQGSASSWRNFSA